MSESAVWLHRAASGWFKQLVIGSQAIPRNADLGQVLRNLGLDERSDDVDRGKLFKIETKRFVSCTGSIALGFGSCDITVNAEVVPPLEGIQATPAICKICGGDASQTLFSRCGHSVYCGDCWKTLDPKPCSCELCFLSIESVVAPINCSRDGEEGICSICFSEVADSIILPCGHTSCWQCACHWFATSTECPFCREKNARGQRFVSYD
jgi:hypothetical protein